MSDKKHWFCFSYSGLDINSNTQATASAYTGYKNRNVTLAMIKENKEYAGVNERAVLLGVSYLGHMTKEEFTE